MRPRLALLAAMIGSVASSPRAQPQVYVEQWPVIVEVDPEEAEPLVLDLWAAWSEDARRGATIEQADLYLAIGAQHPTSEYVRIHVDALASSEGFGAYGRLLPVPCDAESCELTVEISFETPAGTDPFLIDLSARATVDVSEFRDREDLEGDVTLSGPGAP